MTSSHAHAMKLGNEATHPQHASDNRPARRPALILPNTPTVYPGRKKFNLCIFTIPYREKNPGDERVTKEKTATEFAQLIARKFPGLVDSLSFQKDSPRVWRYWCEAEVVKSGYVTRRQPFQELHLLSIREFRGCSSNSFFETTSNQIILMPDCSLDSLLELEYPTFVEKIFEINLALDPNFKLGRMEVFWIWHAHITKVYCFQTEEVKAIALAKAINVAADRYWVDRDDSPLAPYIQPSKQATKLGDSACKSALVLPDCAFLYHSHKDFGTYDRFVQAFLCVNHMLLPRKDCVDEVWRLVVEQRCTYRKITQFHHALKMKYLNKAEQRFAVELWQAIDLAGRQIAEEGPVRTSTTSRLPASVMFKITRFNMRVPLVQPYWTSDHVFVSFVKQLDIAHNTVIPRGRAEMEWFDLGWKKVDLAWAQEQAKSPAVDEYYTHKEQALARASDAKIGNDNPEAPCLEGVSANAFIRKGTETPLLPGRPNSTAIQTKEAISKRKLQEEDDDLFVKEDQVKAMTPTVGKRRRFDDEPSRSPRNLSSSVPPSQTSVAQASSQGRSARTLTMIREVTSSILAHHNEDLQDPQMVASYGDLLRVVEGALQARKARMDAGAVESEVSPGLWMR